MHKREMDARELLLYDTDFLADGVVLAIGDVHLGAGDAAHANR